MIRCLRISIGNMRGLLASVQGSPTLTEKPRAADLAAAMTPVLSHAATGTNS
jgi:hypothetical protein